MHTMRDLCWLSKKVNRKEIVSYNMEKTMGDVWKKTIQQEMPLLFRDIQQTEKADASVKLLKEEQKELGKEGYRIEKKDNSYQIISSSESGLLYGMFGLHRLLLTEQETFPYTSIPSQNIRMINHWDNFDGTIERGYAGESIFFDQNSFRGDEKIIWQYARLLASVGINSISINNVNVHRKETAFIKEESLVEIKKIVDIFSAYGIKTYLSLNFAAPISVGGLQTADPIDREVISWWEKTIAKVYEMIPDFGGFVVKADSEGEPGPFTYGRNHDDGANMLARAVKPFNGKIIWRCFVYNCSQVWWDRSIDRACAAYDIFHKLDGCFDDNVILQIKNGPIDFQIREPISTLFGALKKTNQILEFQITQEYTGHQKDLCYLIPMWKETLEFDTGHGENARVKNCLKMNSVKSECSGIAAVSNIGMDTNWTGNKLAQANLYGYGRLIWNNELSAEEISREWVAMSFQVSTKNAEHIQFMLNTSRETYEDYTCPLAVGFMCKPNIHYGVDVDGYEYDRWGTYHYADRDGVGRDRTVKTGTSYTRQYADDRFEEYENLETCPDELLLFFHHVPYTYVLHSGKTLIQHIYNTHFDGVENVQQYQALWEECKDEVEPEEFQNVSDRLEEQYRNAVNWKNQINTYFYRKSGISDEQGREIYP